MIATRTDWRLIGLLYVGGLLAAWQFAKIALSLEALADVYEGTMKVFAELAELTGSDQ